MPGGTPTLVLLGLIFATACGGGSSTPTSPSTPPPPPPNDAVTINVFNSATGLVRTVYRTAQSGEAISLSVAELNAGSVDALRMAFARPTPESVLAPLWRSRLPVPSPSMSRQAASTTCS